MTATNFNTENRTYRQLLGNGLTYVVPRFQRDYSWGEEEWEELWEDIDGTLSEDGEPAHYMGYLVLRTTDNRTYEIIDGQQRLTTASLIVLAAMRLLKKYVADGVNAGANDQRLTQLHATYIGYKDSVTLITRNKLTLNRNNDGYYKDHLVPLDDRLPQRGFPASTHAMRKGFEWFERRLRDRVKATDDPGMALAQYVESMSDKLFFTVITVADEINAYKVFETLNARGVRLSATDLLKNYLFSVLARDHHTQPAMNDLERRWETIVGRLGSESFPDFLRMHWNSRETFARGSELFRVIRQRIQTPEAAFSLVRGMDEDIDTYLALTQPEGSEWSPVWKQSARDLRMFSVRQPYPMLMAARRTLSETDFEEVLRATAIISFRYNVIGALLPSDQERIYNTTALRVHRSELTTGHAVLDALRPLYRPDESFRADFTEKSIKTTQSRNAKIVRYILCRIEKHIGGLDLDPDSPSSTIEHVLPQSPEEGWEAFPDRDLDSFVYRLGNMLMLEGARNRTMGNLPYGEKRAVLAASSMHLARKFAAENEHWTPERLQAWQQWLARQATAIWRISQLSP